MGARKKTTTLGGPGAVIIQFPTRHQEDNVIEFPQEESHTDPRLCTECVNVMMGTLGLFCHKFKEDIVFDTDAEECECFEPY